MLKKMQKTFQNKSKRPYIIFMGFLLVVFVVFVLPRTWAAIQLRHQMHENIAPWVSVVTAEIAPSEEKIILPGTVSPWHEAPIYARTNGYIKTWRVDIGDQVKTGDLLAEIETPELDAQLRQAEADLNVMIARNKLAQITAVRWINLFSTDSVSKQERDEKVYEAEALAASVIAVRANRDRLRELVGFERVIAPFSGTISSRRTDLGALINAGSNPDAKPLFRLVQTNPLRVYVKIPQTYSSSIKPNMGVKLQFAEHPGQFFSAKLFQTAEAIDPKTRTLLAQFVVQNKTGELLPGGYTEVHFAMPTSDKTVRLPVNTLLFRKEGLQIALLDKDHRVVLKQVVIGRDFGREVEIDAGVEPGASVIINPSDAIYNGEKVRVLPMSEKKSLGDKKSAH